MRTGTVVVDNIIRPLCRAHIVLKSVIIVIIIIMHCTMNPIITLTKENPMTVCKNV